MRINPIKSGSQYGLVQSVLSGISDKMPIETAKEMLKKTPEKLRKKFAKELGKIRGKRGYRNPFDTETEESEEKASKLSRSFHGRDNREIEEIEEIESYDENLAQLGYLVELEILTKDEKEVIPITFDYERDGEGDTIKLCSSPDGRNLLFIGGNQRLDILEIGVEADWEIETGKRLIEIGPVYSISYFADKHHLQGGERQKKGTEYIHEFGEEGGVRPDLVYDTVDEKMILSGGSYLVETEGIKN
jgi:hypothetical protein